MSLRIKKGDLVKVISGDMLKNRQDIGTVLSVNPKKGTALVEGVRIVKRHTKARSQEQPGGIIEQEAAIPLCKLMLVEAGGKQRAGRFGVKVDDSGNKTRVLKIKGEDKEITV